METILELKNLKKYYGTACGIEDVSLKINKGEIYGFIGPNGAGKSTTIRTIMGLINKTSGEIYIKGKKLDKNNLEIKKSIGYLPSEINLYDDMNVKELFDWEMCNIKQNANFKELSKEEIEKDIFVYFMKNTNEGKKVQKENREMWYSFFEKVDSNIKTVNELYEMLQFNKEDD